ncbi:hypothetical protein HYQ46_001352 [Verticillium longisporum]|nr:hypothetical protein HYQ46_001352 [Verticillium longisporum]
MDRLGKSNKRVRQACEPCRRKKSRCSGEQPDPLPPEGGTELQADRSLSGGSILGKRGRDQSSDTQTVTDTLLHDRIVSLELALSNVVQTSRGDVPASSNTERPLSPAPPSSSQVRTSPASTRGLSRSSLRGSRPPHFSYNQTIPPDLSLKQIAETYQRYCDCRPLALFASKGNSFIDTFIERDDEIICAVIAMAARFLDDGGLKSGNICNVEDTTEKAFQLAIQRVMKGAVEVSTLQTFCLLALLDLDAGRHDRARMLCSLAQNLANSSQIHLELPGSALSERSDNGATGL